MGTSAAIERFELRQGDVVVSLLSLGCVTQDWRVPLNGAQVPVVLGYQQPEAYRTNPAYLGAVVGRVANRIGGSAFSLAGQRYGLPANDGAHHLHGGPDGLSRRIWQAEPDGDRAVQFSLHSPDGDGGYPGAVDFEVTISLNGDTLTYDMRAHPDRPTPITLAQHNYYALTQGPIWDQRLEVQADAITPTTPDLIPTGQITPLAGTSLDLTRPRPVSEFAAQGLDLNFMLRDAPTAARLTAPNGLTLEMTTDQPGLQVYTATHLTADAPALPGQIHAPFHGLCLEPQGAPNAVNTPAFPSVIATPEQPYSQTTKIRIHAPDGA